MDPTVMRPIRYDMTRDECRKCLRCLELDAYGSMVSVLRAQGPFTSEKRKLLQELAKVLHISNERHRAEIRRAVNDEKLATIAEQLNGSNTGTDWSIEGRRVVPLLPRLKARTAFTTLANSLSLAAAVANEKPPVGKTEDVKDFESESRAKVKLEKIIQLGSVVDQCHGEASYSKEFGELDKIKERDDGRGNKDVAGKRTVSEKRKSPSPLAMAPPCKVRILSPNLLGRPNHDSAVGEGSLEDAIGSSRIVISLKTNREETTLADAKESMAQGNSNNHSLVQVQPDKDVGTVSLACTTNATRSKEKTTTSTVTPTATTTTTTTENRVSAKVAPTVLLSGSVSVVSPNDVESLARDASTQDGSNSTRPSPSLRKTSKPESPNATCSSIVDSKAKPATSKPVTTNSSHRVMAVAPGRTVSSGPGPPNPKETTTLTCKKLPTTLNRQTTATTGVTLNSNKSVNISRHPNAKLTSKTNVIVIQKGHTKGVTLSHAGKEVLGKVIMGGKNLCVTSQHSGNNSIGVLPHHIALNNGDQAVTMLSSANSSHTESVKSNVKPSNTIVFNLRQDVLEKTKVLSHLLESSSVLTSESKTVIQNTNARTFKEQSDSRVQDKELPLKTDSVITSIKDEKHHRKSKDVYTNANSHIISSIDSTKFLGNKEILINPSQLTNTQDDTISNIEIEETIRSTGIDMFDASLGPAGINFESFRYLVEGNENLVLGETSPVLSVRRVEEDRDDS